ncbi:MAG: flagellar motor switch protein FliN [Bryobacterales bacterium]|nr:flagellar motor switch protein FliN [Bryobacterales bacterium]
MNNEGPQLGLESLLVEYAARLASALEMLTAEKVEIVQIPEADAQSLVRDAFHREMGSWVWRRYALGSRTPAVVLVGASELTSKAIGAKILLAAGIEEIADNDVNDSYAEVQQSAVAALAQWLSRQLGSDIACALDPGVPTPADPADCFLYRIQIDNQRLDPVCLAVSPSLRDLLQGNGHESEREAQVVPASAKQELSMSPEPALVADTSVTRVLDFELPLRVSFGKAYLPLREVLKLTTGSIIELDRSIADPVEIVVNNRVVGRGDVVVVEGNYGIRIQEIITSGG